MICSWHRKNVLHALFVEIFEMMHGHGQGPKGSQQKPKMQPTKRQIEVSLEMLYKGG